MGIKYAYRKKHLSIIVFFLILNSYMRTYYYDEVYIIAREVTNWKLNDLVVLWIKSIANGNQNG
jgi:hypothetical protein